MMDPIKLKFPVCVWLVISGLCLSSGCGSLRQRLPFVRSMASERDALAEQSRGALPAPTPLVSLPPLPAPPAELSRPQRMLSADPKPLSQTAQPASYLMAPPAHTPASGVTTGTVSAPVTTTETLPCVPECGDWRREFQAQTEQLAARTEALEKELAASRKTLKSLNAELQSSRNEISDLHRDVAYWQAEVQRLDSKMKSQQAADLKSLDELSDALGRLLPDRSPASGEDAP